MIKNYPLLGVVFDRPDYFSIERSMVLHWYKKECVLVVPVGFITDLASIPRPIRPFFPVHGAHTLAAIAHDMLYHAGGEYLTDTVVTYDGFELVMTEPKVMEFTRRDADELFYDVMLHCGVSRAKAWLMYKAVSLFGGAHYTKRFTHDSN